MGRKEVANVSEPTEREMELAYKAIEQSYPQGYYDELITSEDREFAKMTGRKARPAKDGIPLKASIFAKTLHTYAAEVRAAERASLRTGEQLSDGVELGRLQERARWEGAVKRLLESVPYIRSFNLDDEGKPLKSTECGMWMVDVVKHKAARDALAALLTVKDNATEEDGEK